MSSFQKWKNTGKSYDKKRIGVFYFYYRNSAMAHYISPAMQKPKGKTTPDYKTTTTSHGPVPITYSLKPRMWSM